MNIPPAPDAEHEYRPDTPARPWAHRATRRNDPPAGSAEGVRMPWSWRVGRFAGIDVYIHATFLILIGWLLMIHFTSGSTPGETLLGIVFVLVLFLCVVLHEFGHALTAARYGIKTRDITLLPIGGVARLERIPRDPWQELVVALAGPAVNVVIAAVLAALLFATGRGFHGFDSPMLGTGSNPFADLMYINVSLVVFNMLPAFPMDGGRVLRALLSMKMTRPRATRIASLMGQGMAVFFGLLGLMGQPFLLFIALFVYMGAAQECQMIRWESAVEGLTARDAMVTDFHTLLSTDTLSRAVTVLLQSTQHDFPVLDERFGVVGVLFRQDLIAMLSKELGADLKVSDAMRPVTVSAEPEEPLVTVFERMQNAQIPVMPVFSRDDKLLGLLTIENVAEVVMIKNALERSEEEVPHGTRRGLAISRRQRSSYHLEDMEQRTPAER